MFRSYAALKTNKGAEHRNICSKISVTEFSGAEHRNIKIQKIE
jgi:hypothetical protein